MLFTTEALVTRADVNKPFEKDGLVRIMEQKEKELLALYQQKHDAILKKNRQLEDLVFNSGYWWLDAPDLAGALRQVKAFINNINRNFGEQSSAWQQIKSAEHRAERKKHIIEALIKKVQIANKITGDQAKDWLTPREAELLENDVEFLHAIADFNYS